MESRNITLTLDKAKEFYNSGNTALREVALQAFTEEELTTLDFTKIKTFEDACKALGISIWSAKGDMGNIRRSGIELKLSNHLIAIYKLDTIRKALNKDWNPSLIQGSVHYPYIRFYPAGPDAVSTTDSHGWKLGKSFIADGQKYTLVGGSSYYPYGNGLSNFGRGYGDVHSNLGLLGCKSKGIAEHMSRYFSKEIFEAIYAQHVGTYEWV